MKVFVLLTDVDEMRVPFNYVNRRSTTNSEVYFLPSHRQVVIPSRMRSVD